MTRAPLHLLACAAALSVTCAAVAEPALAGSTQTNELASTTPGADDFALPTALIEKLTPDQIVEVLREREMRRQPFAAGPPNHVAGLMFFGALIVIVVLVEVYATRREQMRQETLRAMVEKGIDLAPDLVARRPGPSSDLRRGIVLVGAGLGLALAFAVLEGHGKMGPGLWSIGAVPVLMGVGYLVVWRVGSTAASGR